MFLLISDWTYSVARAAICFCGSIIIATAKKAALIFRVFDILKRIGDAQTLHIQKSIPAVLQS